MSSASQSNVCIGEIETLTKRNGCTKVDSTYTCVPGVEHCRARHDRWVVHASQVQVGDSVWLQPPWSSSMLAQGQVAAVATVAAAGRVLPLTLQVGHMCCRLVERKRLSDSRAAFNAPDMQR